jgi:hypothetical protein
MFHNFFKVGHFLIPLRRPHLPCVLQVFKDVPSLQQLQFCLNKHPVIYKMKGLFEVCCHADLS